MSVASETSVVLDTLGRIDEIESVLVTLPEFDERRGVLRGVIGKELAATAPVRPRTAAQLLGLTEKTVRAWAAEGVLTAVTEKPRMLLDATRLREVWLLVRALREAGKTRGLLDEVYRRLSDEALLDRQDLRESLAQMHRGEGTVLAPRPVDA